MKNFIFISPNFPESYWRFCAALQRRGFRVLGIGDCPYAELKPELKVADRKSHAELQSRI